MGRLQMLRAILRQAGGGRVDMLAGLQRLYDDYGGVVIQEAGPMRFVNMFGPDANRILIQLPGVEDPETVIDVFRRQAFLEWKLVVYPPGVTDFRAWNGFSDRQTLIDAFGGTLPSGV